MADVVLNIPIKSEHINLVTEAFSAYAGKVVGYTVKTTNPTPPMIRVDNFSFTYPVKGAGETTKQFGERVIKSLVTGFVKCYKLGEATESNRQAHNAIPAPAETVPEIIS